MYSLMAKSITWDTNALCRQFIVKSIHVIVCWKKKGRAFLFSRRVQPFCTWSYCFTANWSLVRWFQMCPQIHRMKTLWIVCVVLLFTGETFNCQSQRMARFLFNQTCDRWNQFPWTFKRQCCSRCCASSLGQRCTKNHKVAEAGFAACNKFYFQFSVSRVDLIKSRLYSFWSIYCIF